MSSIARRILFCSFLEPRPLLRALEQPAGAVLLIDDIDKSDPEFEAFLLELLSDYQVSIPEIGTVHAETAPLVLLTSNSTRDLGDALKRRCLHLHIGFPDERLEARIIASRVPGARSSLGAEVRTCIQGTSLGPRGLATIFLDKVSGSFHLRISACPSAEEKPHAPVW
jgi:hypothetical protein